jgi:AcrR family transcriptional regulator
MENLPHPIDRRSRRTRRMLKEAFFALVLEKGYDTVTIEDITERADLGRTTFYLHYRDKEELLLESIDAIAEELIARLPPEAWRIGDGTEPPGGTPGFASPTGEAVFDAIHVVFQHAAENVHLYRVFLRGEGARQAQHRLHVIISMKAAELIHERVQAGELTLQPNLPLDVFCSYFAGALLATITWWLETSAPYTPEQMADMFRRLFFLGGRRALGIE